MNWIDVRSVLYASAAGDFGSSSEITLESSRFFQVGMAGIRPRVGRDPCRARSNSSLVLIESSKYSKTKAKAIPKTRPTNTASTPVLLGVGFTGIVGTAAGVTS